MQVCLARTGVFLCDGATNVLPIGPHRGQPLSSAHEQENRKVVHAAWRQSRAHIRDSLMRGFFQGWDLHPAQVPVRYATMYAYFHEGLEREAARLRTFVERAAQATLAGNVFDDAATGQGLLNYFVRAVSCGALTEAEAASCTGLTLSELQGRSFGRIVQTRAQPAER
jgi:hypothetical protein